jgi:hypothetical protein
MFINGQLVASNNFSGNIDLGLNGLRIGGGNWDPGSYIGYMDELRISKGISRYNSNFTPSSTAFTNDSNTVLLIHFDGSNGSQSVIDSVN